MALSTTVLFTFVHVNANSAARVELDRRMMKVAEIESASISELLWTFNTPQIVLVISAMVNDPDIVGVQISDEEGKVVATAGNLDAAESENEVVKEPVAFTQKNNNETVNIGMLTLVYSKLRLNQTSRDRLRTTLFIVVLLTVSVLFSALLALRYAIRQPLHELLNEIRRAQANKTHEPISWSSNDEMGTVVHAYNDLQNSQQEYQLELRTIQNELEQRVESRTKDLKAREQELLLARDSAETALGSLKSAQARLVQSEKMASLGQLTAGIAHEIKNPLNFINNFSKISVELMDELLEDLEEPLAKFKKGDRESVQEVADMLSGNLTKIRKHGRRADSIVKNMLAHSRHGPSSPVMVNINSLAGEALDLVYHGSRAETPGFNITKERDFASDLPEVECYSQDVLRVFINIMSNGMYEAHKHHGQEGSEIEPRLIVRSSREDDCVRIDIEDNGKGIEPDRLEEIFNPFYTTKPAGEGTGLGLSLSFDIIVTQHGGELRAESDPGDFTRFSIFLPIELKMAVGA